MAVLLFKIAVDENAPYAVRPAVVRDALEFVTPRTRLIHQFIGVTDAGIDHHRVDPVERPQGTQA